MIALLKTAERINNASYINNYIFQRHVFAYKAVSLQHIAGKQVLELGCGEGYGMKMLAPHTAGYLAIDKKKPTLDSWESNVSFETCNLPVLSNIADNTFDTVICFQVIEHIKDDHAMLREIHRVLKPGGSLLLTTPNQLTTLTRNPFHVREYKPQEMVNFMEAHFTDSTVDGIYGNNTVMAYYEENKRSVQTITKYDILNLQHHLPAFLLRVPYTLLNNFNRLFLLKKMADITTNIMHTDFYLDDLGDDCLDYFVTATKSRY
jgi:2-polyprenyl-3-methyl-5-hydroxy-6-metoxy-1,4-benzoquinol methylase